MHGAGGPMTNADDPAATSRMPGFLLAWGPPLVSCARVRGPGVDVGAARDARRRSLARPGAYRVRRPPPVGVPRPVGASTERAHQEHLARAGPLPGAARRWRAARLRALLAVAARHRVLMALVDDRLDSADARVVDAHHDECGRWPTERAVRLLPDSRRRRSDGEREGAAGRGRPRRNASAVNCPMRGSRCCSASCTRTSSSTRSRRFRPSCTATPQTADRLIVCLADLLRAMLDGASAQTLTLTRPNSNWCGSTSRSSRSASVNGCRSTGTSTTRRSICRFPACPCCRSSRTPFVTDWLRRYGRGQAHHHGECRSRGVDVLRLKTMGWGPTCR